MTTNNLLAALLLASAVVRACTDILVTPGASVDGSSMITYNADALGGYEELLYEPHSVWPPNSTMDVTDRSGKLLGRIPQVPETFTVIGQGINEYQVAVGESTFDGLPELGKQSKGFMPYYKLMTISLQRSRTAREAIAVIDDLVQRYGYESTGESISISDPKEVWLMEIIGKGEYELGAVWVAQRIPDGYVSAHANQARIRRFRLDDPENTLYSKDVISFAKAHGFYPKDAPDEEFSFSDVYHPVTFQKARACEARVWSVFRHVAGEETMNPYTDHVLGKNLTNRLPLWVKPLRKLSLNDTMMLMRDHYEGTVLENTQEVGAEAFGSPYRWHPQYWEHKGRTYLHERTIATQQDIWGQLAQSRSWLPREIGGILWFGTDDTSCTVYYPVYCSSTAISKSYGVGPKSSVQAADFSRAIWTFNLVANFAYSRWNIIYPSVFSKIQEYEAKFIKDVAATDAAALKAYSTSASDAVKIVTEYSVKAGDKLASDWFAFYCRLFYMYRDGLAINGGERTPGYSNNWKERVVAETGDHYLVPVN